MRLLFVIDSFGSGGSQRQIVNLALGLHTRGHEIDFFVYAPGDALSKPLYHNGIRIFRHEKSSRYSPGPLFHLGKRIRKEKYELILSYLPTPNFYSTMARFIGHRDTRLVVSERSSHIQEGVPISQRIIRQTYRLADFIVVNSHHLRRDICNLYPWLENRVSTIYNGIDLDLFRPPEMEPGNRQLKIIAIGSVLPGKNISCLVKALFLLREKHHICPKVNWVGEHHVRMKGVSEFIRKVEQEIQEMCLLEQWSWLYQRQDIVQLLQQHHVLVHPSSREGLPNVVCEALACGRPVIASDAVDHPRLVQHGKTGFLFDWRSPESLAEAIRTIHDISDEDRHRMGIEGRHYAERNLSLQRLTEEYEQLFSRLIGQN